MLKHQLLLFCILIFLALSAKGQEVNNDGEWDHTLYYGTKVAWGKKRWRHSVEFQSRYNQNLGNLEQLHLEYIATYLISENWEIAPDFRVTRKPNPNSVDYRPGLGIIRKDIFGSSQLVQQVKWQYDVKTNGRNDSQGIRYAVFYNKVIDDNWIVSMVAGLLYEWGEDFSGILGFRGGPSVSYVFNKQHSINLGYFYGLINNKIEGQPTWTNVMIPAFSLIINIRKDYQYLPAKYINF